MNDDKDGRQRHGGLISEPWDFRHQFMFHVEIFHVTLSLVLWSFLFSWPKYQGGGYFLKYFIPSVLNSVFPLSCQGSCLSISVLFMPWVPGWKAPTLKSHSTVQHIGRKGMCATVGWKLSRNDKGESRDVLRVPGPLSFSLGSWLLKSHICPELVGGQAACEET